MGYLYTFLATLLFVSQHLLGIEAGTHPYEYLEGYMKDLPGVELEMLAESRTAGDQIYLGEFTICKGSVRICKEASTLIVANAPEPDKTVLISSKQVSEIVSIEWPEININISGPSYSKVFSSYRKLDPSIVRNLLQAKIAQIFNEESGFKVSIVRTNIHNTPFVREEQWQLDFPLLQGVKNSRSVIRTLLSNPKLRANLMDTSKDMMMDFEVFVQFKISALVPVLKTQKPKHVPLEKSDFEMAWMEINRNFERFLLNLDDINRFQLKRSIYPGSMLKLSDLQDLSRIRRGTLVDFSLGTGGVEMTGKARALKNGVKGEVIEIELLGSGKKISAMVESSNRVKVEF